MDLNFEFTFCLTLKFQLTAKTFKRNIRSFFIFSPTIFKEMFKGVSSLKTFHCIMLDTYESWTRHHHVTVAIIDYLFRGQRARTDMIFVKSFTQATFQQIWKFTQRMGTLRHFSPPKILFLAFESQKCDIQSLSSWNTYFLHLTISTLSKNFKKSLRLHKTFFHHEKFYPNLK